MGNAYKHCVGCELLCEADYNLCLACYEAGAHRVNVSKFTSLGHRAKLDLKKKQQPGRSCGCAQRSCQACGFCIACSCRCHFVFETRHGFQGYHQLRELQEGVSRLSKRAAGEVD